MAHRRALLRPLASSLKQLNCSSSSSQCLVSSSSSSQQRRHVRGKTSTANAIKLGGGVADVVDLRSLANSDIILGDIIKMSARPCTPTSLRHGGMSPTQQEVSLENPSERDLVANAQFLWHELPIRLAQLARELENLPYGLGTTASIRTLHELYVDSFTRVRAERMPQTVEDDERFTQILDGIASRHVDTVPMMALGIREKRPSIGAIMDSCPFLQDFLDRFFLTRTGIRFLIGQHIALHHAEKGWVGNIDTNCSVAEVAREAVHNVSRISERTFGDYVDVDIVDEGNCHVRYIPSHLHHILFELLKNSMRAVIEFERQKPNGGVHDFQPIKLVIVGGEDEVTIKISDRGGGIRREDLPKVWTYTYTTAGESPGGSGHEETEPVRGDLLGGTDALTHPVAAPMAGFGYGLPISRVYARYFGGDIKVMSMDGHGTDTYCYLSLLGDSDEPLA